MSEVSLAQKAVFGSLSPREAPPRQEVDGVNPDGARILVSREVELRRPTTLTLMGDDGESFSFQAVPVWQKRVSPVARVVGLQFLPEQVEAYSYRWWLAKPAVTTVGRRWGSEHAWSQGGSPAQAPQAGPSSQASDDSL